MKTYIKLFVIFISLAAVSACTSDTPEVKSPCVGIEGSPCDRRSPTKQAA
jgi:hypothetical protein